MEVMKTQTGDHQSHFKAILEKGPDAVSVLNKDGYLLFQNEACIRSLGYQPEELLGLSAFDLIHPGDLSEVLELFSKLFNREACPRSVEFRIKNKDGEWKVLEAHARILDHPEEMVVYSRDISFRKKDEEIFLKMHEDGQTRLAEVLQEGLQQHLAGIHLMARLLQQNLENQGIKEAEDVGAIVSQLESAMVQAGDIACDFYPTGLNENVFSEALEALAQDMERLFHIRCEMEYEKPVELRNKEMALPLYGIVRDVLRTAICQSGADHILLSAKSDDHHTVLAIRDNGQRSAFHVLKKQKAFLRMIEHRARLIGSSVEWMPNAGGGMTFICSFQNQDQNPRRADNA